jgi:hypothetical protein
MTPLIDVQEAWQRLHNEVPRLFEKGIIRYHGKLGPGQKAPKRKGDWIQELRDRGETQIRDSKQFSDQIDTDKMITMTTDGGANPNPGPAGWGVLNTIQERPTT